MKKTLRLLLFTAVPFLVCGIIMYMIGIMHGQSNFEPRRMDLGDVFNFVMGGSSAALVGALIEFLTRKKPETNEPKLSD